MRHGTASSPGVTLRRKQSGISDFPIDEALQLVAEPSPLRRDGLRRQNSSQRHCVVEHRAVLERLRQRGAKCYGAGENGIMSETESCVASIDAHGTGKDLQQFNRNFFCRCRTTPPSSSSASGAPTGRADRGHRVVDMLLHCRQLWWSFEKVKKQAEYIQTTTGQRQRIEIATLDIRADERVVLQRALANDPLWMDYHD